MLQCFLDFSMYLEPADCVDFDPDPKKVTDEPISVELNSLGLWSRFLFFPK